MIAVDEDIQIDPKLLPRLIEHAKAIGDWGRVEDLSARMGVTSEDDEPPVEALQDEEPVITSLPFAERIKRRLQDYGVFEVNDLAPWTYQLLRSMLSPRDVAAVRHRLAAIGMGRVVGSDPRLLTQLPAKNPVAVDVRQGVTLEDLKAIARRVFRRELTQRTASEAMGGPEGRGWHQRWPSSFDRNADIISPVGIEEMNREYRPQAWFAGAELTQIPEARRRRWGALVHIRCPKKEAFDAMGLATLTDENGRGVADGSWLGMSIIFKR